MKRIVFFIVVLFCSEIIIAQEDTASVLKEYKRFYYPNGKVASEGFLKNNKPVGLWKSYYVTGVKKSEGIWRNNQLDSTWIFFNQLGDTTEKINYYLGKKNGYYYKFYAGLESENRIERIDLYVNGKKSGKSLVYYKSGDLFKEIPYVEDNRHGIALEYTNERKIITITRYRMNEMIVQEEINRYDKQGKKSGIWKEFYKSGTIKEERNYTDGKLDGYVKRYNEEGKLVTAIKYKNGVVDLEAEDFNMQIEIKEKYDNNDNLIYQGSYKNNTPIGIQRYFNSDGKVINSKTYDIEGKLTAEGIVLLNGLEDGKWTYYYKNGNKRSTGNYNNGKKTGQWIYNYPNEKIQQKGSYINGKLTGLWQWYYETGELLKEENYMYGNLDGESVEYTVTGNIISKGNYIEGKKEGEWIYVVGDQKYEGKYVMGEKNGAWKSYYLEENNESFEGNYIHGNPDGKHTYYYPQGAIKEERYYSEGKRIKAWSKYNEQGDLIIVIKYKEGTPYKINGEKVEFNQMSE